MSSKQSVETHLSDNIKNKDDFYNLPVENPLRSLKLDTVKEKLLHLPVVLPRLFFIVLIFIFLFISARLNNFFFKSVDPAITGFIASISAKPVGIIQSTYTFFFDIIKQPYVVTIGEYGNLQIATEEAKRLLPMLRQIFIKQLNTGIYTFEIQRFSSKKEAYLFSSQFKLEDLDAVHVRYLPDQ